MGHTQIDGEPLKVSKELLRHAMAYNRSLKFDVILTVHRR